MNNYNDFLQALSDGSEKGDFVNQVSEKLAKDLNKEMKTGSKLFNNVDNLFNGDKDATLKRLMHGNTPRNQKNVGFKPEMARMVPIMLVICMGASRRTIRCKSCPINGFCRIVNSFWCETAGM